MRVFKQNMLLYFSRAITQGKCIQKLIITKRNSYPIFAKKTLKTGENIFSLYASDVLKDDDKSIKVTEYK